MSGHTLMDPTPREELRDVSTDRPDTTESAYSVDAGHVQLEMSVVDLTRDGGATSLAVAPFLFKIGLLDFVDLQLGLDPLVAEKVGGAGAMGAGDTTVRLKVNVWGNDGGPTAFVVMPFAKLPTASAGFGNGRVDGGVILPFAFTLPGGFDAAVMPELDVNRKAADDGYLIEIVHTATTSHDLVGPLGGFVEYAGFADLSGETPYRAYVDAGLTAMAWDDVQLDVGGRLGLTSAAEDVGGFVGVSFRR
jgi:hypothetical protein